MKTTITILILALTLLGVTSADILQNSGMPGYTGSPGEASCAACHSGGSSAASGITLTAVPSFSFDEYMADTTYQISITTAAAGFSRYGFGCEILDSAHLDAGTLLNNGAGVKFQSAGNGRMNAVHTTAKTGSTVTFQFDWTAPSSGPVYFHISANAVNGNNNFLGDFPLQPVSHTLIPAIITPQPEDTTVVNAGLKTHTSLLSEFRLFPNPSSGAVRLSCTLDRPALLTVQVHHADGRLMRTLNQAKAETGHHTQMLDLAGLPAGVYLITLSANGARLAQKRVTLL